MKEVKVQPANWNFDAPVPEIFVDHIRKSVPGYDEGHDLITSTSDFFCLPESTCYELGTSTGELIKKLALHHRAKREIRWIGIDREPAMIEKARKHCRGIDNINLECDDICLYEFEKADLVVAYYCIQFIPARYRQSIFDRIYEALNWGGALILFEKVRAPDARFQDLQVALYNDFKLKNGFTPEQIMEKSSSLKGVLEPFSSEGNLGLMKRAGFVDIMTIMKNICFEGFLAIK